MTERIGNVLIIAAEGPTICETCNALAETRPYGFNGARICYNCFQNGSPELKAKVERTFDMLIQGD